MSEPIMELIRAYSNAAFSGTAKEEFAAIGREVAALRERAERAEANYQFMVDRAVNEKLDGYRELGARAAAAENAGDELKQRIADLEAERAALMEAGNALAHYYSGSYSCVKHGDLRIAERIFTNQPGALAAWLARGGR